MIVEDFEMWNGRHNLPLKHNKNYRDPYIHFPWENNSCALDATMSVWWVLYNNIYESGNTQLLTLFHDEYELLINIFKNMHDGETNNLEAKTEIRKLFESCDDSTYTNKGHMTIDVVQMFLKNTIYKRYEGTNANKSIFHWYYDLTCCCEVCGIQKRGLKRIINIFHTGVEYDSIYSSIQEAVDGCIRQDDPHLICPVCTQLYKCQRITTVQPHVITLTVPILNTSNAGNYKMKSIDRTVTFNDIEYELLAAVYGDDTHFVCRYVFDDKIYEADGLQEYKLGDETYKLHAAESIFISNDFFQDMNIIINKKLAKRYHKQVANIYYIIKQ